LGDSSWEKVYKTRGDPILDKEDYCNRVAEQYALCFGKEPNNILVAAEDASANGMRVEVTAVIEVGVGDLNTSPRTISTQLLR
jgi:hypothetical protein